MGYLCTFLIRSEICLFYQSNAHRTDYVQSFFYIEPLLASVETPCIGIAGEDGRGEDESAGELHING